MSKIDDIKTDLESLDALTEGSSLKKILTAKVRALEDEREALDERLRLAVKELDAEEAKEDPAKKEAAALAMTIANKYGKSISDLRKLVELVS